MLQRAMRFISTSCFAVALMLGAVLFTAQPAQAEVIGVKCPQCCGPCKFRILGVPIIEVGCMGKCGQDPRCLNMATGTCTNVSGGIGWGLQCQCLD